MDEKLKKIGIYLGIGIIGFAIVFLIFGGGLSFGTPKEPFNVWKSSSDIDLIAVQVNKGYYREATVWLNTDYECTVKKWRSGNTYYINIHACPHKLTGNNYIGDIEDIHLVSIEIKDEVFDYPV